jgi:uncharacterized protein YndB with AHSA1/START domain
MSQQASETTVRRTITVEATQERAFAVFTEGQGGWWPPQHKIGPSDFETAVVEPREGGRWFERDVDGSECDWGRVLAWEPPHRLVLAWQISAAWQFDPELVTEVEVRFVAEGPSRTRVELEHRGLERYGDAADAVRGAFEAPDGWDLSLGRFAEAARA